jgi:hypothetical protein
MQAWMMIDGLQLLGNSGHLRREANIDCDCGMTVACCVCFWLVLVFIQARGMGSFDARVRERQWRLIFIRTWWWPEQCISAACCFVMESAGVFRGWWWVSGNRHAGRSSGAVVVAVRRCEVVSIGCVFMITVLYLLCCLRTFCAVFAVGLGFSRGLWCNAGVDDGRWTHGRILLGNSGHYIIIYTSNVSL